MSPAASSALLLCALLQPSLALPLAAQETNRAQPNIVVFLVDDMGWRDPAFQGHSLHQTPAMDQIAQEGTVFRHGYANAPNCAPSRACLMSGLYPPRHGIYTVGNAARGKAKLRKLIPVTNKTVLHDDVQTLAETLTKAGYTCGTFGKWHLGDDPRTQGFAVNVGGTKAGHPKSYFSPYKNRALEDGPEGENLTDRMGAEAAAFVATNRERPFFLYLPFYAVHTPIQAKPALAKAYAERANEGQNAKYAAMVQTTDEAIATVLDALRENGLDDNTVIVFSSDNGGHGPVTSMAPLRGAKGMLYEGGIRVPFAVRWKGRIPAGRTSTVPITQLDLYPTLVHLAGATKLAPKLDGRNLAALWLGKTDSTAERDLHWHFPAYLQRTGRSGSPWRTTPAAAMRRGRWKLIEFFEDGRLELYDLESDIGEATNLATEHPERVAAMHGAMKEWRKTTGAFVPTEPNPRYSDG